MRVVVWADTNQRAVTRENFGGTIRRFGRDLLAKTYCFGKNQYGKMLHLIITEGSLGIY